MPFGSGGEFTNAVVPAAPTTPAGTAKQVAKTPSTGTAFGASQASILTWTAPNDGQMHQATYAGIIVAGAAGTTGGAVRILYTAGGQSNNFSVSAGTLSANQVASSQDSLAVDPGTTVNLQQATGLAAGAATIWASIMGV